MNCCAEFSQRHSYSLSSLLLSILHAPRDFRLKSYKYFHRYYKFVITNRHNDLYGVIHLYIIIFFSVSFINEVNLNNFFLLYSLVCVCEISQSVLNILIKIVIEKLQVYFSFSSPDYIWNRKLLYLPTNNISISWCHRKRLGKKVGGRQAG